MKRLKIKKKGWNLAALLLGPFWYINRGMKDKGLRLLLIIIATVGLGLIPVGIYCGHNANKHFYNYLKESDTYIY